MIKNGLTDEEKKKFAPLLRRALLFVPSNRIKSIKGATFYRYHANNKDYIVVDGKTIKIALGNDYNYVFDKITGSFDRWGKSYKDNPKFAPIGPEILDIEITTSCNGINGKLCSFCYKSNTPNGKNMSFKTFKSIMDKMGKQLTQVAFGADSQATSNPDLWKMAAYCRKIGIIPNITVANISNKIADKLAAVMGAVSVSVYDDKNICYDSVKRLTDRGMTQVNLHFMISRETYQKCLRTINDIKRDRRLRKLNAIIMLSLKQKGRGIKYHPLSKKLYNNIVKVSLKKKISFGMDSCGAVKFLDSVKGHINYPQFLIDSEPCEATDFSQYIDVDGWWHPCSFCEGSDKWKMGIDMSICSDFLREIWYNIRVKKFRNKLNSNCNNCHKARECPIYKV